MSVVPDTEGASSDGAPMGNVDRTAWPNPYGVPDEADRIQSNNTEIKNWSENVLFWLHDGTAGTAVYIHLSVISADPRLVEGVVAVVQGDGTILVHRSIQNRDTIRRLSSGALTAECIEPNRRWNVRFDGVMQETTEDAIATGTEFADPRVPVSFNVFFDAVHPVWSLGAMAKDQDWAHFHTQQGGRYVGSLSVGARQSWIDCSGLRDHSVGPRDYGHIRGSSWLACIFPSGRTVMGMRIWSEKNRTVAFGFLAEGASLRDLEVGELPDLTTAGGVPGEIVMTASVDGAPIRVTGRCEKTFCLHFMRPVGNAFGYKPIDDLTVIDVHSPAVVELDGETGYGWLDRTRRVEYLTGKTRFPSET